MTLVKNISKPQYFVKFAIYFMLIGQLWTSIDSYLHFDKIDLKECFFVDNLDNDTGDCELDFEKLFKDKLTNSATVIPFFKASRLKRIFYYKNALRAVDHLEIHTPPPDFFLI